MPVTADTLRIQRQIRSAISHIADQQTRDMVRAWADAWDEVAPDLNATLLDMLTAGDKVTRAQLLRSTRLQRVLLQIADRLEVLVEDGRLRIVGDLRSVVDTAGAAQASVLDSQLPPNYARLVDVTQWSQINPATVDAIVARSTQQITSRMLPLSRQADTAVRRELVRGIAAGSSPRETARRMVARAEGRFNGGLTRALGIARTETLDAHRAGALAGRMQNVDVLAGWMWICELSTRSCPACIAEQGTLHAADEPGPNDHVNGRCTAMPVTKSWADFGFDIPEPEPLVTGGEDWFNAQSAADQRTILGPKRHDAWKSGDYPISDWSKTVGNDGWRDSVQVTRAPAQRSGGRSSAA